MINTCPTAGVDVELNFKSVLSGAYGFVELMIEGTEENDLDLQITIPQDDAERLLRELRRSVRTLQRAAPITWRIEKRLARIRFALRRFLWKRSKDSPQQSV